MNKPIYLDYAATTPVDPQVAFKMQQYLTYDGIFGNPASKSHQFGWQAAEAVDVARNQIADFFNVQAKEIIFTSGATESNNLAIIGTALANQKKGNHIISCEIEHKSVLSSCSFLEQQGFEVTYLPVNSDGLIDLEKFKQAIRKDTILASIMYVNNEIGVIQDIPNLSKICKQNGIVFHVDATQAVDKFVIDLREIPIDLMSCSSHKLYGPKGIGALFVRNQRDFTIQPIIHGGNQEFGLRSGTLPTHQIVGMGEAYTICKQQMLDQIIKLKQLRDYLHQQLNSIAKIIVNGSMSARVVTNLNVSFVGLPRNYLISNLIGVAVSSGSACSSNKTEPSYVLKALNISDELAYNAIRFSLGRYTTKQDIDQTILLIKQLLRQL